MAFGRGRGRGRGAPIARHDIQLEEDEQVSDVPIAFPKPTLGQMPPCARGQAASSEVERLLMRFTKMRNMLHDSPYYFRQEENDSTAPESGSVPDLQRFYDAPEMGTAQEKQRPLHEVIFMHEKYMPKELFSEKEQKKSLQPKKYKPSQALKQKVDLDMSMLEKEAEGEKDKEKEDGDDDDEDKEAEQEEEDDDDDLDHEAGDYYQGEHFDDDEEYDDGGGNSDGEAYF